MNKKQKQILSYLKHQKVIVKKIRDPVFRIDLGGVKMGKETLEKLVLKELSSIKKDISNINERIGVIESLPTISNEIKELK